MARALSVAARARNAAGECLLELVVDERTASGGHKFKLVDVTLQRRTPIDAEPCVDGSAPPIVGTAGEVQANIFVYGRPG